MDCVVDCAVVLYAVGNSSMGFNTTDVCQC